STGDRVSIGATTGKLNLDLLAGNTSNNASISLGRLINISLNGGDLLADAGNPDNGISLRYVNNGQIHAGNVTLNVSEGLSGYAYRVQADNDLTINGPVSGNTGWGVTLGFTAGGQLAMNSPGGISLQANDTSNGGGRVLVSGDKGVTLNGASGTVTLKAAKATTNGVDITSSNGAVNLHAGAGTLDLGKANISAKGDITLKADNGSVWISGTNATAKANIASTDGNVTVDGIASAQSIAGLRLRDVSISAKQGEITITGNSSFDSPQSTGSKAQIGAVVIDGSISLESQCNILNARNTWITGDVAKVKQIPATALLFGTDSSLFMTGTSFINARASAGAGIVFDSGYGAKSNTISIVNGDLHINASTGDAPLTNITAVGAITINNTYNDPSIPVYIILDNANVSIEADASGAINNPVYGFAASSPVATGSGRSNGFVFKGSGNVIVKGRAAKGDGVNARLLNNTGLSGSFSVQGESDSGSGVSFDGGVNAALVGAEIRGESKSGAGIAIQTWNKAAKGADLRGSNLNGISETGA
ncbi:hypothetical protein DQJ78_25630, partial [Salmonella enterica subsp. enterica serovar Newport]|nr:hypothetical protein [Salmonella enterica subsp. enterica serovar Newport]EBS4399123.1 hypothetical protein [Salmonella enterica subsp. enterica serovar Newport]EBY9583161.1 hypothetical protein [Salmonella enterica subsp. enterica serovar Newport]